MKLKLLLGFLVLFTVLAFAMVVILRPNALSSGIGKVSEWFGLNSESLSIEILFDYQEIDSTAGDVKLIGDIDGDDYPDLVIGGMPSEGLNWYRYPDWAKTSIAIPSTEFTTDGTLGDIDGDGDLDIIVPDGGAGDNLLWFENPLPSGDPSIGNEWLKHAIGSIGSWGKDVHAFDFDSNGRLDIATRHHDAVMIFFQNGENTWTQMTFSGVNTGGEGMAAGDIDGDSDTDLVLMGVWLRNPGGNAGQTSSNWSQHTIGPADSTFKALIVDLNEDGKTDVLFSSSEGVADVDWWTPSGADPTGPWTKHTIVNSLEKAHTLQAADMDLDGDLDVVLGQMHTSSAKEIMIMFNVGSQALTWEKQVVDNSGIHNGVVADIGNDDDFDIYGANWTGNPPVKLWENRLDEVGLFEGWTYKQITNQHDQTFSLAFGDVNGDDHLDILSGVFWYANPGGDLLGNWVQSPFPSGMHVFLVTDVDGDQFADVIAQKDEGDIALYWLEAQDTTSTTWTTVYIGSVDQASHGLGAQGYRQAQVEAGGKTEILITSGNGIYYFRIPDSPESGNWPKVHVNANPSDEGFSTGDIDGDGLLDIAATTGNSKRVEWYKNPGDGSSAWTALHIGDFNDAIYPDRTEVADLNGDNRLDIIVTEENGGDSDAQSYWWEQPTDPTAENWDRHLIVDQGTTNSMDVADMDADGDIEVILAEHRGDKKLAIWENDGSGNLSEHIVDIGKESHLGAQVVDLDGDGDLDIVSIAWDDYQYLHLWRNESGDDAGLIPTPTSSVPVETDLVETELAETELAETDLVETELAETNLVETDLAETDLAETDLSVVGTRVSEALLALYDFSEGEGNTVHDVADAAPHLHLSIDDPLKTRWLPNGGLEIMSPTVIASVDGATKLIDRLKLSQEITTEVWMAPRDLTREGPARVMAFSIDGYPNGGNFIVGQEYDRIQSRLRTTSTDQYGLPGISSPATSLSGELAHVAFTRDVRGNATLYLNGESIANDTIAGDFANWVDNYRFSLANEPDGKRPWLGTLYLVAIYDRALEPGEVITNYVAGLPADSSRGSDIFPPVVPNKQVTADQIPFGRAVIDDQIAGDVKMVGDIDGDTYPDLVIGGMPNEKLNWYRYPSWDKYTIATPDNEFTTDGALGDVDGDGDLDIVVPDGPAVDNLSWFENPRPLGDPTVGNQWTEHSIGSIGGWGKDIELADFDGNGELDVATRHASQAMIFFQMSSNSWSKMALSSNELGGEGMGSGDIDSDGYIDLVLRGVWLRNPGGGGAVTASNWIQYSIGAADGAFKALVVDLNMDGQNDVLFSSSEGTADVDWWTPSANDATGVWQKSTILPGLGGAHTLQAADMDLDGDVDVVLGQMHTSAEKEIVVMYNTNGSATTWEKQIIGNSGIHNGVVADIGNDGDYDVYGANWTGNPPVKLWENKLDTDGVLDRWTYKQITANHLQTFGLTFGDLDGDQAQDIISGGHWYRNPGGNMLGDWTQGNFPNGMHAILTLDVDDDQLSDVIAQKDETELALYWLEAQDASASSWNSVKIGSVERASHGLGAQGYRVGQVEAGGKTEILITSGNGIYYFRIPDSPESGNWPRVHVNANPSDEGFALGDIDNDHDLDVAATTGDSMRVEWYQNPGDGSGDWIAYYTGTFTNFVFPDRTEIADLNEDGRLDIIVSEENGADSDAETFWWEAPLNPTNPNWNSYLIVSQGSTNSMDVADMDNDGDTDVVLAEHRGTKNLTIWENDGSGNLLEHIVDNGKESHLGAQVVDLDSDGDLDIVSIAWDGYQYLHLWRNDSVGGI